MNKQQIEKLSESQLLSLIKGIKYQELPYGTETRDLALESLSEMRAQQAIAAYRANPV